MKNKKEKKEKKKRKGKTTKSPFMALCVNDWSNVKKLFPHFA